MQRLARNSFWLMATVLACACGVVSQTSAATSSPSVPAHKPWKKYCQPNDGFCFKYPSSWMELGEVFAGNGVVVAPAQKQDRALWDSVTVAMVTPPTEGDEQGPGLDAVVQQATTAMREAGQNFQTLQRSERTVDHKPAQTLKTQYHEKATDRDWIEELTFIEGPDNEIYSVALKCAPQNLLRLEPVLAGVLGSWTLPQPAPPPEVSDEGAPAQAAPSKKVSSVAPQ